ncbi:uncharacterized protein LOC116113003 [Pistacia vera]|uniref:uncharacterized protein LOC116113003 n=1 Tax=Pistacia vera TaxID=55513 RepID=UPI001262C455|nr:uncharacterized protein LOC116113003 [Pistacia vera]
MKPKGSIKKFSGVSKKNLGNISFDDAYFGKDSHSDSGVSRSSSGAGDSHSDCDEGEKQGSESIPGIDLKMLGGVCAGSVAGGSTDGEILGEVSKGRCVCWFGCWWKY